MVILKFGDLSDVLPYGAKDIKVYPRSPSAHCNELDLFLDIVLGATMLDVT